MIQYPKELPYPDLSGYSMQHGANLMRTPMVNGRARQRRRYKTVPTFISLSWEMSHAEFALFEAWVRWDLKDGVEWFTGWANTTGFSRQVVQRFMGSDSAPPYTAREAGYDYWRVSVTIEIRERQTLPEGWQKAPDFILNAGKFDRLMNKVWPEA